MKRSSSSATSLVLATVILAVVSLPCSALEAGQETIAKVINAAGYDEAHEPQGGHVGWRPPPPPEWRFRSSYPDYGSQGDLVPPPASALKAGQETKYGASETQGNRKGRKPPSPWPGPGYATGDPSVPSEVR